VLLQLFETFFVCGPGNKECSLKNVDRLLMCRQKSWRVKRRHWRNLIGLDSLFQKTPMFTPKKKNEPLSQEMHLKILHLCIGLKMSRVVKKLLFTYLWNRYHQQIHYIKLIQIGTIPAFLCKHYKPLFHCWIDNFGLKLPSRVAASDNDHLHMYSLWYHHMHYLITLQMKRD
jgi:hypothetical protein